MKKIKGFSLTEVIVTVLIIAVLGVISGPIYNSYSTKTKQAEGFLLLGAIKDAHMKRYVDSGQFCTPEHEAYSMEWTANSPSLGIDARANKYYTWFNANTQCRRYGGGTAFTAIVQGKNVANITMIYSLTTGTTVK